MGLDMFLTAEISVSGYPHSPDPRFPAIATMSPFEPTPDAPMVSVATSVAYWRKANQIHGWFVRNVQGGTDDCGRYLVSVEQLEELVNACKTVLGDHDQAEEILPPEQGFFFGGYEIDDWYFDQLKETIEQLVPVIDKAKEMTTKGEYPWFYYQSSW